MYSLAQIEDAILAILAPMDQSHGVVELSTYQGELAAEDLKIAVKRTPALLVVYGGSTFDRTGEQVNETLSWSILAIDRSVRLPAEARRGGAKNPGVYALLEGVRALLLNRQPLEELGPLAIVTTRPVALDQGFSIYESVYETDQTYNAIFTR